MTLSSLTPNRISRALEEIRKRCEALSPDELAKLDRQMAISFEEHFQYQEAQARAHVSGVITADEAQLIYQALGEGGSSSNGGWKSGTTTAEKVVVTLAIGDLLKGRKS